MFNNTVYLVSSPDPDIQTGLIDGPTNQRTLRRAVDGTELSIGHTDTNENPGFVTQRSNVRIQVPVMVEESDKVLKAYAQLTLSFPKGQMSELAVKTLIVRLLNFMVVGDDPTPSGLVELEAIDEVAGRFIAGEP
jgi:hypothetical protein